MKKEKLFIPLNIQLFAENLTDEPADNENVDNEDNQGSENSNKSEPKFTQEDVDQIVQGRVAKAEKAWKKQLEDEKTEAEKLAGMSEKDKKKYQEEKRVRDLDEREAAITRRELTAQAKIQLADKGIPTELAEILNLTDADSCKKSIDIVEKAFQSAVEKAVEQKLKGGNPPKKAEDDQTSEAEQVYKLMMGK